MQNERIFASFSQGNRSVKVTRDEIIFGGENNANDYRYPLNQIVLAKMSGGFADPRSLSLPDIGLRFHVVPTGEEIDFSGPGIEEFYQKIQPLLANK